VQIRTVLEDAWGEVQHELMYKSRFGNPEAAMEGLHRNVNDQLRVWKELLDSCGNTADVIKELIKEIFKSADSESGRAFPSINNHQLTKLGLPAKLQKRINDEVDRIEALYGELRDAAKKIPSEPSIAELVDIAVNLQDCLDRVGTHPKRQDAEYHLGMEIALSLLWIGRLLQEQARQDPGEALVALSDLRESLRNAHVLTRSADEVKDLPFAIESLDEAARRYFAFDNSSGHPGGSLLAFRLGEVLAARDEPELALSKFEEAFELLEKDPQFSSDHAMRSYIPRRLGFAYWEAAESIRQKGLGYGSGGFMLSRRRDTYIHAIQVTRAAYDAASAALGASPGRTDMRREAQLSANNLLYYSIEFLRAKGTEDSLVPFDLGGEARRALLKFIVPTPTDLAKLDRLEVVDTIRESARLSGDRDLEVRAAKHVLALSKDLEQSGRYVGPLFYSMVQDAKNSLATEN
jgi:tetratricopeptide (TPR) repeat protein